MNHQHQTRQAVAVLRDAKKLREILCMKYDDNPKTAPEIAKATGVPLAVVKEVFERVGKKK
jgi:hypothetical protein